MAQGNGVADFNRRLARVPASIRKAVSAALEQNAKEWVKASRSAAPDDPTTSGQDLKASIRHHATDTGGQVVRAGGPTTTVDGCDYALAQEFGTQDMPANPFYWPIYRMLRKRFDSRRRRALNKAFKDFNNG